VGVDPLKITMLAMALTATALPLGTFPFLILMNDKMYLRGHTNGPLGNVVVLLISIMAMVLGVVSIPLQIMGG
jgi:Mn2+/Fe2+ NRAMP family transporter